MIKDNSIVLDFEYSASAEDGTLVEILQFGAVRIINGDLCDFFNGIVLPAMDHIGSASRKRQMEQMLESNSVVRGSYEEVLVRYLKWLGYHVHETFIWGGTDYHALVRNTEKYCSQKVCSELAPHLTQFVDLVHSYHQSYRRNSATPNEMLDKYQMEFYGTPHNAIDDAINAARLLLHLDVELKNHLPKEFLNSSFLQNEVWKPPINYEKNPTFKSYARSVLEKKFAKGYISPDKRIVMERFVLTAPFSDHFLRYLKKRDVDEYLWKMKTYPPAEAFYRDIYKMVRDVVEKAEIEGLVSFPDEKNQEEKRKERRRKKQAMQRRKLWDYSERLFNRNWYIPKDKFICEIAFFTGMPFDSIVTLRGSDVECELKPVFGYPWTEGIRVQSESLGEFLSSIGSDEWLFSPDGLSFPDQSDVETVFRQECIRLGIDKGQDFSKLQDCYQKLKAKEFLEHFDSFDISSEQDDPEALPTCL